MSNNPAPQEPPGASEPTTNKDPKVLAPIFSFARSALPQTVVTPTHTNPESARQRTEPATGEDDRRKRSRPETQTPGTPSRKIRDDKKTPAGTLGLGDSWKKDQLADRVIRSLCQTSLVNQGGMLCPKEHTSGFDVSGGNQYSNGLYRVECRGGGCPSIGISKLAPTLIGLAKCNNENAFRHLVDLCSKLKDHVNFKTSN
ncbi:hypothetical protein BGX27_006078, partial [Mortierella sp. AM989]